MSALLVETGMDTPAKNVAASFPSKRGFCAMMDEEASRVLAIVRYIMDKIKKILPYDGTIEKGLYCVVKTASWWFSDRAMSALMDSDAATSDNQSTTQDVDASLRKVYNSYPNFPKELRMVRVPMLVEVAQGRD